MVTKSLLKSFSSNAQVLRHYREESCGQVRLEHVYCMQSVSAVGVQVQRFASLLKALFFTVVPFAAISCICSLVDAYTPLLK